MNGIKCLLLVLACAILAHSATLTYPLKVTYLDNGYWQTNTAILDAVQAGYNVIVLSFYMTSQGPVDAALSWTTNVDAPTRQSTMQQVHAAGAVVLVSLGGASDGSWEAADPNTLGAEVANWAKQYDLDGVDFDLEHPQTFASVGGTDAATIAYFVSITNAARNVLGTGGIISHAPVAPWFGPVGTAQCSETVTTDCTWVGPSGGMTAVYAQAPSIDYFFIQFYNQGSCYTTQAGLFTASGPSCDPAVINAPLTSVAEIASGGIPLKKLVVGKPVNSGAATTGYVAPGTLGTWIQGSGVGGAGIWEYGYGSDAIPWIKAVYPGSGSGTLPPAGTPGPTTQPATQGPTTQPATQGPTSQPATQGPTPKPATQAPTQGLFQSTKAPTQRPGTTRPYISTPAPDAIKTNDAPRPTIAIAVAVIVVLSLLF